MKKHLIMILLALMQRSAWAETVTAKILRVDSQFFAHLDYIDSRYAPLTANSFYRVSRALDLDKIVFLRVIAKGTMIGTSNSNSIIVSEELDSMDEITRCFIIAHEMGHHVHDHVSIKVKLYQKYIPKNTWVNSTTLTNANKHQEIIEASHLGEYEADEYALRALVKLGYDKKAVLLSIAKLYHKNGNIKDTDTHPSTLKRIRHLKKVPI